MKEDLCDDIIAFIRERYGSKGGTVALHERDAFLEYTNDRGIQTRPARELMNTLPMFSECFTMGLPNAIFLADRLVNIPSSVI